MGVSELFVAAIGALLLSPIMVGFARENYVWIGLNLLSYIPLGMEEFLPLWVIWPLFISGWLYTTTKAFKKKTDVVVEKENTFPVVLLVAPVAFVVGVILIGWVVTALR